MEDMQKYIESEIGQAAITLIAYTVKRTPTQKDDAILQDADAILQDADAIATTVAGALAAMADQQQPTDKDAKRAAVVVLEAVAKETKTKIDDVAVALIKRFIG
jgi:hypothetical protein